MFITNDAHFAKEIVAAGVERVFVDWEVHGKFERQGHLDTVQSNHSYDDLLKVRRAVPDAELMVRLNPFYQGTAIEVEKAIKAGANLVMLPMFSTLEEVQRLSELVAGRVGIVPLFETPEAMGLADAIAQLPSIHELYVGLNDLHLALGKSFMFQPLAEGMLEEIAGVAKKRGLRFGFGGIARANEGAVSGSMVLGEHIRLGSDAVILSRTFYRAEEEEGDAYTVFLRELQKLRSEEIRLQLRSALETDQDHKAFCAAVEGVVAMQRQKALAQ